MSTRMPKSLFSLLFLKIDFYNFSIFYNVYSNVMINNG